MNPQTTADFKWSDKQITWNFANRTAFQFFDKIDHPIRRLIARDMWSIVLKEDRDEGKKRITAKETVELVGEILLKSWIELKELNEESDDNEGSEEKEPWQL